MRVCSWIMLTICAAFIFSGCGVPETRDVNGLVKVTISSVAKGDKLTLLSRSNGTLDTLTKNVGDTPRVMADTSAKAEQKFYIGAGTMVFTTTPTSFADAFVVTNVPVKVQVLSADDFNTDTIQPPNNLVCQPSGIRPCLTATPTMVIFPSLGGSPKNIPAGYFIEACLPLDWPSYNQPGQFKPRIPNGAMIRCIPPGSTDGMPRDGIIQQPVDLMIQ